ncbi:MAG TPA: exosortase N [Segetibacter sp.]|jgi:exosortase N
MVQGLIKIPWVNWLLKLQEKPLILLVPVYIILIITGWNSYFPWQSPISWFGLGIITFLCRDSRCSKSTVGFYWYAAAFFIALTFILPVKTFLYFSLVLGVVFFIDTNFLKCGYLPLFTMIIISPIFNYITTVFTFPIRLELTSIAAQILSFMNPSTSNAGNIIHFNGADFSVDAECMGLSMVSIGLLTGVLLLSYYQRRTHSSISFVRSLLFLMFVLLLVLVCNLFRIVFLVQFHILPETLFHEVAGLVCYIIYVLIPVTLVVLFLIKRKENEPIAKIANNVNTAPKYFILKNLIIFFGLIIVTVYVKMKETSPAALPENVSKVAHYKSETVSPGTIKLENENSLVYIKKIKGFYSTEHSPMICWKGSGYVFHNIERNTISGTPIYVGKLINKDEVLYTAWWFDNGEYRTINQIDWRWKVLRGTNEFSIINVTTGNQEQLQKEVSQILNKNIFRKFL